MIISLDLDKLKFNRNWAGISMSQHALPWHTKGRVNAKKKGYIMFLFLFFLVQD